jgi:acyl carrier protein
MDIQEIQSKVIDIISKTLKVNKDKISPNAHLVKDLGMDDYASVLFTLALEEEFDIEIPDRAFERMHRVQDIVKYLKNVLEKA